MKILVVHEVSYLRKVVYEIHEFPELLALRGHEVTFVDFDEDATRESRSKQRIRKIGGRVHNEANITLATPHAFGAPRVDRLWATVSVIPLLFGLFSRKRFDIVLNYAVPTYGLQVILLARLFRVPVIHRALDVSSKIRVSAWNPLIALWEKTVFFLVDRVSANNPAMQTYVSKNLPSFMGAKVDVHYPPLDLQIFMETNRDMELAARLGIGTNDKVVMYMGTFFYFSGLPTLISSMERNLKSNPALKILLIGGGEQEAELRALVQELGIKDQVIFAGFIDFRELPKYMALADVAVNPLENGLVAGAAFPHKVLQYMAVGLPVVSTKLEGLYSAFSESSGIHWVIDSEEAAREAVNLLHIKPEELKRIRKVQRESLERLFSIDQTVTSLEKGLEALLRKDIVQ